MERVEVDAKSLRELLAACSGPDYLIREIKVIRSINPDNCLDKLIREFNAAVEIATHPAPCGEEER